jgi:uncharacterized protein YndB with AHSA1/START domain
VTTTTIGGLTVAARGDLEIVMTRAFRAPAQLVFDAWTKPEHVKRWFGPSDWIVDPCEIDLRPGGKYRFVMRKDTTSQSPTQYSAVNDEMCIYGQYMDIDAPRHLVCTENFEEPYFESMGAGTINTLTLAEESGTTMLEATSRYKSREARDVVLNESGMASGVAESFDRMEALLAELSR